MKEKLEGIVNQLKKESEDFIDNPLGWPGKHPFIFTASSLAAGFVMGYGLIQLLEIGNKVVETSAGSIPKNHYALMFGSVSSFITGMPGAVLSAGSYIGRARYENKNEP